MKLEKQDVYIPFTSTSNNKDGDIKRYFTYLGDQLLFKEVKQVYVLTPIELEQLISNAMSWIDDTEGSINKNSKDFLKSIEQT